MGYACPVCADPQADAGHLANHLAFTAMLGDDAHERWLETHAEGWGEMGEADLAEVVTEHVEETTFPQVFEDTAGGLEADGEDPRERSGALFEEPVDPEPEAPLGGERGVADAEVPLDDEAIAILREAREMTRERNRAGTRGDAEADVSTAEGDDGGVDTAGGEGRADADDSGGTDGRAGEQPDGSGRDGDENE